MLILGAVPCPRGSPAPCIMLMSMPEHSDSDSTVTLLLRAKNGDDGARDRLFRRLTSVVRRWAHLRLPPTAREGFDSDGLVQDAVAAEVKRMASVDTPRSSPFYVHLHNTLRGRILEELSQARARSDARGEPTEATVEDRLDAGAFRRYQRGLARLAPEDQAAIFVRIELGMSLADTAVELDKPSADAAHKAVSHAVRQLIEAMQVER